MNHIHIVNCCYASGKSKKMAINSHPRPNKLSCGLLTLNQAILIVKNENELLHVNAIQKAIQDSRTCNAHQFRKS